MERESWNAQKKALWEMDLPILKKKIEDLKFDLIKGECRIRMGNMRSQYTKGDKLNLKQIRKKISAITNIVKEREKSKS